MSFFKNLFRKREPFVPSPTQTIPGLEPIVVQAIENLFPDAEDQKKAFKWALDFKEKEKITPNIGDSPHIILALLSWSEGKVGKLPDKSSPYLFMRDIYETFSSMKKAEEWVKSITKPKV